MNVLDEDFNHLGYSIVIEIVGHSSQYVSTTVLKSFILTINLETTGPDFVLPPSSDELNCDPTASSWSMMVPEVILNERFSQYGNVKGKFILM